MMDAVYFEELYRSFGGKMYGICLKYSGGDTALSSDIVQEVFLSLWERRHTFSPNEPERYLMRAAKLKLLEYYRNTHRRLELFNRIARAVDTAENYTENDVISKELAARFSRQLEELPEKQRMAFRLQQTDCSKEQIAEALQTSERTVDNYLSLATKKLKAFIKAELHIFF